MQETAGSRGWRRMIGMGLLVAALLLLGGCSFGAKPGPATPVPSSVSGVQPQPPARAAQSTPVSARTPVATATQPAGTTGQTGEPAGGIVSSSAGLGGGASVGANSSASAGESPVVTPTLTPITHTGDLLFVPGRFGNQPQGVMLLDGANGRQLGELPAGVPAPDWSAFYVVEQTNDETHVRVLDPAAGPAAPPLRQRIIQGDYEFPSPFFGVGGANGGAGRGYYGLAAAELATASTGLSANGQWMALAGQDATPGAAGPVSRFVVFSTAFTDTVQGVVLNGDYRFYAVSDDGNSLYLLENAAAQSQRGYRWQLRVYDLQHSRLVDAPLKDQTGAPVWLGPRVAPIRSAGQAGGPAGPWLYDYGVNGDGSAAIYGLNTDTGEVHRVDLPPTGSQVFPSLFRAMLVAGKGALYVVNGMNGAIVEINTTTFKVSQGPTLDLPAIAPTATVTPTATPQTTPFPGGSRVGASSLFGGRRPIMRTPILSPDGKLLLIPSGGGLVAVDGNTLSLRGVYLLGTMVDGVAFSPGGRRLYVLDGTRNRILQIDPQTGALQNELDNVRVSAGILHVAG
jgi:hypothetical protein